MGNDSDEEPLSEEMIDETLEESFPTSDPPSWTLGRERRKSGPGDARSMESDKGRARNWPARSALVFMIAMTVGVVLLALARSRLRGGSN